MDSNEGCDVEYEVEKIFGIKETKRGVMYHVRWRGYSPSWDSWEPQDNLHSCTDMIEAYRQHRAEEVAACRASGASRKRPSYIYVDSSDEESNTLKDNFWNDLERGKIDVFSNDMYSNVKSQGRASRPQTNMFGKRPHNRPKSIVNTVTSYDDPGCGTSTFRFESEQHPASCERLMTEVQRSEQATSKTGGGLSGMPRSHRPPSQAHSRQSESISVVSTAAPTMCNYRGPIENPAAQKRGPTHNPAAPNRGPTQNPAAQNKAPTQNPAAQKRGPTQNLSVQNSGPTQNPVAQNKGPTQHPAAQNRGPTQHPAAQNRGPTQNPTVQNKGPTQNPVAQNKGPTQNPVAQNRGPTQNLSAQNRGPTQNPAAQNRGPTQNPAAQNRASSPGLCTADSSPSLSKTHLVKSPTINASLVNSPFLNQLNATASKPSSIDSSSVDASAHTPNTASNSCTPIHARPVVCNSSIDSSNSVTSVAHTSSSKTTASDGQLTDTVTDTTPAKACETALNTVWSADTLLMECARQTGCGDGSSNRAEQQAGDHVGGGTCAAEDGVFPLKLNIMYPDGPSPAKNCQMYLLSSPARFAEAVKLNDYSGVSQRLLNGRQSCDLHQVDHFGRSLAMVAAQHGFNDMVELLVSQGVDVNAVSYSGVTALMLAAQQGLCCTVELLQLMGAHLNRQTGSRDTALTLAVRHRHPHIVRLLLDHGSNFSCPYTQHPTLDIAISLNDDDVTDLIKRHVDRVMEVFDQQVALSLAGVATARSPLFLLQCLQLDESELFTVNFQHRLSSVKPNIGMVLFIGHALIEDGQVQCRFHGRSAVLSVHLNGTLLTAITKEKNFVFMLGPLHNGFNQLQINTLQVTLSKVKLLVRAYKVHLV